MVGNNNNRIIKTDEIISDKRTANREKLLKLNITKSDQAYILTLKTAKTFFVFLKEKYTT